MDANLSQGSEPKLNDKTVSDRINEKDQNGYTVLHYTVDVLQSARSQKGSAKTRLQMLGLFFKNDYTSFAEKNKDGATLLRPAVKCNDLEAVKLIIASARSKLSPRAYDRFIGATTFVDLKTFMGRCPAIFWTPSPEYQEGGNSSDVPGKSLAIFNLFLSASSMKDQDNSGYTIAHWVVAAARRDMFEVLVKRGADFAIRDVGGCNVLDLALHVRNKQDDFLPQPPSCRLRQSFSDDLAYLIARLEIILKPLPVLFGPFHAGDTGQAYSPRKENRSLPLKKKENG